VFKAFYGFGMKLDTLGICLSLMSCMVAILINGDERIRPTSSQFVFPSLLAIGGILALLDSKRKNPLGVYGSPSKGWDAEDESLMKRIGIPLWMGGFFFLVWLAVLILVICLVDVAKVDNVYLEIFETMYRIGSIIFGGGQVVLPMLADEVVPAWMTEDRFLQGLGLAQSMPGPLFNFSAYVIVKQDANCTCYPCSIIIANFIIASSKTLSPTDSLCSLEQSTKKYQEH
jgi:chromate transporter